MRQFSSCQSVIVVSACRKKRHCITQTGTRNSVSTTPQNSTTSPYNNVVVLAHRRFIFQYAIRRSTILPHHHGHVQCHCWIDVWHQPCVLRTKGEIFRSQLMSVCLSIHAQAVFRSQFSFYPTGSKSPS